MVEAPHHVALVIKISIVNQIVKRVLVDNSSSTNMLFLETLKNMQLDERRMRRRGVSLIGFDGRSSSNIGEIQVLVLAERINFHTTLLVIDSNSACNVILGKPWILGMKVVSSTYHQLIKFSTP